MNPHPSPIAPYHRIHQLAAVRAKVAAPEIFSLHPRDDPGTPLYAALYRPDPDVHGPGKQTSKQARTHA